MVMLLHIATIKCWMLEKDQICKCDVSVIHLSVIVFLTELLSTAILFFISCQSSHSYLIKMQKFSHTLFLYC